MSERDTIVNPADYPDAEAWAEAAYGVKPPPTDLSEHLAQAGGADRQLDRDIAFHAGWHHQEAQFVGHEWIDPAGRVTGLPPFTGSVDAAIALLPNGFHWELKTSPHRRGYFCEAWAPTGKVVAAIGDGSTAALAVCIVAVKLRDEQERNRRDAELAF